ncbi:MAG: hypothetical protein PHW13_08765 [Methylococcales bacterium]|nr:hypothetical protein [Methylococcales bacterium]
MNKHMKLRLLPLLLIAGLIPAVQAAPRDAGKQDGGAVQKLQAMVKSLTTERDAAKAETAKLTAELEQVKKDSSKSLATATAAKEQLDSELTAQKNSNTEARDRLDKTNARLLEVIDKYKAMNQSRNQLDTELNALKSREEATEQQLKICGEHNVKLLQSAKQLLDLYQNKNMLSSVFEGEPVLQFNSIEMENIVQDYEDQLNAGIYKK